MPSVLLLLLLLQLTLGPWTALFGDEGMRGQPPRVFHLPNVFVAVVAGLASGMTSTFQRWLP